MTELLLALILIGTFGTTALIWREVRQSRKQITDLRENLKRFIRASAEREFKQIEAALSLQTTLKLPHPLPPTRGWAASPDLLLLLYRLTLEKKPALIVECGSGVSTVVLAKAAATYGGRVVSLDHDPAYCLATQSELQRQGLSADVRLAPLVHTDQGPWYDLGAVGDLSDIELLFVDGPPAATGPQARFPALPLLVQRCAPTLTVVLDDTARPDEHEIGERWAASYGLTATQIGLEKGALVLTREGSQTK